MDMIENNLKQMIDRYKRDNPSESIKTIAAKKGVTPETVSRHQHNKIDMSMHDIKDYADILGCTTLDIIYTSPPIPVLADATCESDDGPIVYKQSICPNDAEVAYVHGNFDDNLGCAKVTLPTKYQGKYKWVDGAIELFSTKPCFANTVPPEAFMRPCLVRTVDENLYTGLLYPQAGSHLFSLVPFYGDNDSIIRDLDLHWATPIVSYIIQPQHWGVKFVPANLHPKSNEKIMQLIANMNARRKAKGMGLVK
jgi:hypothetical protein